MSYCFNPRCCQPNNEPQLDVCNSCGAELLLEGRYRGVKLLGKSQLAMTLEVFALNNSEQDPKTSPHKVLKILLTDYPKAVELFQQEAEILGTINHESIPKIAPDGYFTWQPLDRKNLYHCLVIDKIPGLDLLQWFQQRDSKPISEQQAKVWLKQILAILAQLHQAQYFHRDIKPANIIMQPNGKLALIDFGAARKMTSTYLGKVGTNKGVTSIGTPGYVAPEQIDGAALPQSDFFSLGRTMVHLLTGSHPQELPRDIDTGAIIWRDRAETVSSSFADLLDSMMNHVPVKRPIDIESISNALNNSESIVSAPKKPSFKLKLPLPILLGTILLPFSLFGIFSFGRNLNQKVASKSALKPLCNNLTCVNRDAVDNRCDQDVQTITSNIGNYRVSQNLVKAYRLEIRFSPSCQATWAKSEAPPDSTHYIEDDQGTKYGTAVVPVDQFEEHYADMAPGKNINIRACAEPPSGNKRCTNFVQM